ncbi:MAG: hypothetical protein BHV59_01470 [Bifidobacterium sp. 56_9_plus]|nr:MAG: hypothetical protein BHV59_01470 [Bifidobacterium sp. 56_9_plus]
MERLTQTSDRGGVALTFDLDITCEPSEIKKILKLAEKLKDYEDAEEQGLLLRLPCGIGTDIYYIPSEKNFRLNLLDGHGEENRVFHQTVDRITFRKNGWYMECDSDLEYGTGRILLDTSYGVTWFLTSEEAEAKLKEMEEKDGR